MGVLAIISFRCLGILHMLSVHCENIQILVLEACLYIEDLGSLRTEPIRTTAATRVQLIAGPPPVEMLCNRQRLPSLPRRGGPQSRAKISFNVVA